MAVSEKPHENHIHHLCSKIAAGATIGEIKNIVQNAKFVCGKCGRVATKTLFSTKSL